MSEYDHDKLPEHIRPGSRYSIGSHTFEADKIIEFATKWDPQPFHTDAEKAKNSLFGGLCASGWHTASIWMKLQRKATELRAKEAQSRGETLPEIGPSPGMRKLRWLKPVFAGDTVKYFNEIKSLRASSSKPEWYIMSSTIEAFNQNEELVMSFDSTVFLKLPPKN